mmetsp:Transcript_10197/g.22002  ORF Transcript_10197/g.22002 Transcript_10197/m.22002 type:complete len:577 (+) Transcript_10197:60-1790(+)
MQKAELDGVRQRLQSFKMSLLEAQRIVVDKLDAELRQFENLDKPDATETLPVDVLQPGMVAGPQSMETKNAWDVPKPPELADIPADVLPAQGAGRNSVRSQVDSPLAFNSLSTVAKNRRKHMSWIHKNQQADLPKSAKGARNTQPVFSQLHAQFATDRVRQQAIQEFDNTLVEGSTETFWTRMVQHGMFERISLLMIYLNAMWLAVDIEFNDADVVWQAEPLFIAVEVVFVFYFVGEAVVRYMSYATSWKAIRDPWFIFDMLLVVMMLLETWVVPMFLLVLPESDDSGSSLGRTVSVLRVARVLRVLRTARIVRVARYMPELLILIKGLMVAARSVFFTLVLLLLITYVFSIAFARLSEGTSLEEIFPSALLTLIVKSVMPDREIFFREVASQSWFMGALVLIFILIGSLIVLNMLVGILVEAVQTVATMEHEQIRVDFAKNVLWQLIAKTSADQNKDNKISEQEFLKLIERDDASEALLMLGVDMYAAKEYSKLLFEDGEPLSFGEFMDAMLTLRGSNQTTVKDIVNLRKFTADEFSQLHAVLLDVCRFLAGQGMSEKLAQDLSHEMALTSLQKE